MEAGNLASKFNDEELTSIALRVIDETKLDLDDRREWDRKVEIWTKHWACEPPVRDNPPWEGSSNVVIPLVASACEQAHNRAYAAFFDSPSPETLRCYPVGENDVKRTRKVERVMNWQTRKQIDGFEVEHDRLFTALPNDGVAWTKWYWDAKRDKPAVIFIPGTEVIVPYGTKPMRLWECRRITHRYELHASEIQKAIAAGKWRARTEKEQDDIDNAEVKAGKVETKVSAGGRMSDDSSIAPAKDTADEISGFTATNPENEMHVIYERHEDLMIGDKETSAIVLVDVTDGYVLNIDSREKNGKVINQFIDWHFIWNPYGFYSYGYGHFLGPLNEIGNTIFNQYIDAGKVANLPFVFYTPGARFKRRKMKLAPGDAVEVRDITQVKIEKMAGIDGSLGQLLQIIDRYGSDMSDNTDEARGRVQKGVREPTVRGQQGRLEQTLMGFGVKIRRMVTSMTRAMETLYNLNAMFLDKEIEHRILGSTDETAFNKADKKDFDKGMDIMPTASPGYASRGQLRAEILELADTLVKMPNALAPRADGSVAKPELADEILRRLLATYSMGELVRYIPEPPAPPMKPGEEHQSWLEGEVPDVSPKEDLAEHAALHRVYMTAFGANLPEDVRTKAMEHIAKTQQALMAKMQIDQQPPVPFSPGVPTIGGDQAASGAAPAAGPPPSDFQGQPPMPAGGMQ